MRRLLLVLIPALLVLTACTSSQTSTKTGTATPTPMPAATATPIPPTPVPATQIFKPGDQIVVSNNQTQVMLTVSQPAVIKAGQYDAPAKGEYLGVPITILNQGTEPFTVSSLIGFELRDQDGQGYTTAFISNAPKAPNGEVAPNQKLAGTLVYDVAPGKAYQLLFKANFLSSGQAIIDLGRF